MTKTLLIDTNVFLSLTRNRLFHNELVLSGEYVLATVQSVIDELKTHQERSNQQIQQSAQLALQIIANENLYIAHESASHADDALIQAAHRLPSSILTQDKILQKRAKKEGINVLSMDSHKQFRQINN